MTEADHCGFIYFHKKLKSDFRQNHPIPYRDSEMMISTLCLYKVAVVNYEDTAISPEIYFRLFSTCLFSKFSFIFLLVCLIVLSESIHQVVDRKSVV